MKKLPQSMRMLTALMDLGVSKMHLFGITHFITCQFCIKCKKHEITELGVGSDGNNLRINNGKMMMVG